MGFDGSTLGNGYISYDDLLRDVRDYTGVLNFTANIPATHENASGVLANPQVQELVDQIRDFTRRDLLTSAAPSPGATSLAEPLPRAVRECLSGGASPPSGGGALQETGGLSPAPVPATARRGGVMRNNTIHRPNVVTRRAAAKLTGAVTRYRGARPNKNNNNDDNNINNNNHATLAERFQSSTLHKLRQLGLYTNTDTLDDNNIIINNNAALAERFQPSTLHKLRQVGLYIDTDTPDTAHHFDAEATPDEIAYTRTNTQPSCLGGGESDRVPNTFKETMAGLRHHMS